MERHTNGEPTRGAMVSAFAAALGKSYGEDAVSLFESLRASAGAASMAVGSAAYIEVDLDEQGAVAVGYEAKDAIAKERVKRVDDAWTHFEAQLAEVVTIVMQHLRAVQALPPDIHAASVQLAAHQVEYERVARRYLEALAEWRELDATQGRTRAAVRDRLMHTNDDGSRTANDAPRMSFSAADKAVSGDPEYTAHKDLLAAASDAKDTADVERVVAFEKVQSTRALLAALVTVESAKRGARPSVTLNLTPGGKTDETANDDDALQQLRAAIADALPQTDAAHRLGDDRAACGHETVGRCCQKSDEHSAGAAARADERPDCGSGTRQRSEHRSERLGAGRDDGALAVQSSVTRPGRRISRDGSGVCRLFIP